MAIIAESEALSDKNSPSSPLTNSVTNNSDSIINNPLINYANSLAADLGAVNQQSIMSLGESPFVNSVMTVKSLTDKSKFEHVRTGSTKTKDQTKDEFKSDTQTRNKPNINFSISNILSKENNLMHNLRDNLLSGKI